MNCVDLFSRVVEVCPPFAAQVEEHYADNDELLCHILIADLGRLVAGYFTGKTNIVVGPPTEAGLRAILAVLDSALVDADDDVQNGIAVSLVEHIWIESYFAELEPMLGPNLSAEVNRQRNWHTNRRSLTSAKNPPASPSPIPSASISETAGAPRRRRTVAAWSRR
jgi:hypothetical protein